MIINTIKNEFTLDYLRATTKMEMILNQSHEIY